MIGATISHYKTLEKIGHGSMGIVYKAEDTKLGRTVALKFLLPDLQIDKKARQRFKQEARAASALDHPNICTIYETGETDDGRSFIAMAFYEGESLKDRLEKGPLGIGEAAEIIRQIAAGIAKAHDKEIVHRDLKPANIFITTEGVVKILDFGLAKLRNSKRLTKSGSILGTVAYMAPEQVQGEPVDHRADIWSLGVILFEMLTGELPFDGEFEQALAYAIVNKPIKSIKSLGCEASETIEAVLNKALSKDLTMRYKDASELQNDLAQMINPSSRAHRETSEKPSQGKSKASAKLLLILFSVILTAIVISLFPLKIWRISILHHAKVMSMAGVGIILPPDHGAVIDPLGKINYEELLKCRNSDPEKLRSLRPYSDQLKAKHYWQKTTVLDRIFAGFFDRIDDMSFWNAFGCMLNAWLLFFCLIRLEKSHRLCYQAASQFPKRFYLSWILLLILWIAVTVYDHRSRAHGLFFGGFWASDFIPEVRTTQIVDLSLFFVCAVAGAFLFLLKIHLVKTMSAAKFTRLFADGNYRLSWEFLLNSGYFVFLFVNAIYILIRLLFHDLVDPFDKASYAVMALIYHFPFLAITLAGWWLTREHVDYKFAPAPLRYFWISVNKKTGRADG